jgi:hypothetical protein
LAWLGLVWFGGDWSVGGRGEWGDWKVGNGESVKIVFTSLH